MKAEFTPADPVGVARLLAGAEARKILGELWGANPPVKGWEWGAVIDAFVRGSRVPLSEVIEYTTRVLTAGAWMASGCPAYRFEPELYRSLKRVDLRDEPIPMDELMALPGGVGYIETPGAVVNGLGPDGVGFGGSPGFFVCLVDGKALKAQVGSALVSDRMLILVVVGFEGACLSSTLRIRPDCTLGEELALAYQSALDGNTDSDREWLGTLGSTTELWRARLPLILYLCSTNSVFDADPLLPFAREKARVGRGKTAVFHRVGRVAVAGEQFGPDRIGPNVTPGLMDGDARGGMGGGGGGKKARHWVRAHFRRLPVHGGGYRLVFVTGHYRGESVEGAPVIHRVREERS